MTSLVLLLDILLGMFLIALAWKSLVAPSLYQATIFFMVFGLVMALAWARLSAPDIALAEAAIGAGLTGALILTTLDDLGIPQEQVRLTRTAEQLMRLSTRNELSAMVTALCIALLIVGLGVVMLSMPAESDGLAGEVSRSLPDSGVKNPVTAVLLNFRAYDTLLEVAVLITALLCARGLASRVATANLARSGAPSPVLLGFVRIISPLLIIVAGYLLWVGGHAPGGAFQAGAVLASLGVLLLLCRIRFPRWYSQGAERWVLAAGLSVFLAVGVGVMAIEKVFLQYPVAYAKEIILLIETACTVSIAAILFALFAAGSPPAAENVSSIELESSE